jgi:hypothetical protein
MPGTPRPADLDTSRETIANIGAMVRAAGLDGFEEARALARQSAPDVIRHARGLVFAQSRAAGLILEAAGLVRALPPGSAATPEAEGAGAGEE